MTAPTILANNTFHVDSWLYTMPMINLKPQPCSNMAAPNALSCQQTPTLGTAAVSTPTPPTALNKLEIKDIVEFENLTAKYIQCLSHIIDIQKDAFAVFTPSLGSIS
jgi:hypothetical protein